MIKIYAHIARSEKQRKSAIKNLNNAWIAQCHKNTETYDDFNRLWMCVLWSECELLMNETDKECTNFEEQKIVQRKVQTFDNLEKMFIKFIKKKWAIIVHVNLEWEKEVYVGKSQKRRKWDIFVITRKKGPTLKTKKNFCVISGKMNGISFLAALLKKTKTRKMFARRESQEPRGRLWNRKSTWIRGNWNYWIETSLQCRKYLA